MPDFPSCIVSLALMLTGVTWPCIAAAAGAGLDASWLPAAPRAPATTTSRLVKSPEKLVLGLETSHRTCGATQVVCRTQQHSINCLNHP